MSDGVLTDGRIWLLSRRDGTASEIKGFSAYDGAGLKLARGRGFADGTYHGRDRLPSSSAPGNAKLNLCIKGARRSWARTKKFCEQPERAIEKLLTLAMISPTYLYCSEQASRLQWRMPRPR